MILSCSKHDYCFNHWRKRVLGSIRIKVQHKKNAKMLNRTESFTLKIRPDSSEYEVKQAFRQLAKKYHPDVCRGNNCGVQFQTINEAYNIVLKQIKNQMEGTEEFSAGFNGMNDPDCDTVGGMDGMGRCRNQRLLFSRQSLRLK
ncbi:hypothetical protein HID58_094628 [Brassica napus]|uniref:J domain-containing protein n=1 Tax=Brassica napus TaxID=3708 RepID=A0ABQ7X6P4_BRANA|nr:hypothetical protein HID58_094628 [Brassica napus]